MTEWLGKFRRPSIGEVVMWTVSKTELNDPVVRLEIVRGSKVVSFSDVIHAWQGDAAFRTFFNAALAEAPFHVFRWELPALTSSNLDRPFECVLVDSPGLERKTEPDVFAEHFLDARQTVVSIANLRGDATLIVPLPLVESSNYGHLASFVRRAPDEQRHFLWKSVGVEMARRVGAKPVWLSTAGGGVAWLHVRLDDRPKYYHFRPYKEFVEP